jgi:hypothetical protein
MKRIEQALLNKLDLEESEKILQDPQWIDWDDLPKQLKS